jgi:ABC-type lipoprotein export system ATPase subunit
MTPVITVLRGKDKSGNLETMERFDMFSGCIYSIVGFTGSGKSQLISDIEQMAQGDTLTGRKVLINGVEPDDEARYDSQGRMVAQLSQNMNFTLEMEVADFLRLHAECRGIEADEHLPARIIESANTLAGEPIGPKDILTRLSGGQSRALMIADVAGIGNAPIVLIDEVENAGIDRGKAVDLLAGSGKTVLIVTHDPQLALLGEQRMVMKNGGMEMLLTRTEEEREAGALIDIINRQLLQARNIVRQGRTLSLNDLK